MTGDGPHTGPRHEPERIHERAADPAEAANRPLEPKSTAGDLRDNDMVAERPTEDAHHHLNTAVGEPDPNADSDPYRAPGEHDEADRASGTSGAGQGAER